MAHLTPKRGYTKADSHQRRQWLFEQSGISFEENVVDEPEDLKGIIENQVGTMAVPVAIAGPLTVKGDFANSSFYVPLCTVEGTLALSMTRGALLTHLAGGIKTQHIKQEISRSPIFVFEDISDSCRFVKWIGEHFADLKRAAESTTQYGKLLRVEHHLLQNRVILDFVFTTAEAAGQNMVTIATHTACHYISECLRPQMKFRHLIECNFNGDKNPAYKNLLQGRGHSVMASCLIEPKLLRRVLRASADDIVFGSEQKRAGSQLAGVLGLNMHTANALAAIYLATGQDVACVAENAVGMAHYEKRADGALFASLSMPSITIGTVGGGTRLKAPQRHLELLGCKGEGSSKKLAEIICAAALALELSLAGAIVSQEFAHSHARYGR